MSSNNALGKIPIVVNGRMQPGRRLYWQRRAFQLGAIAVALLIPISGLIRIDIPAGAFVVLDRQIWFSDFYIVFGLWLALASGLVLTYSSLGTVFCGWACPQNTVSEWANRMNQKLLGKHAEVSLNGEAMRVSAGKSKWFNWTLLGVMFIGVSMLMALIPMFYFYPPSAIWSFISFQYDERLAGSLHWIYFVFVAMIFLDVAFIRHFLCRFMCIYRVWQHSFKTRDTLHIEHDKSHPDECARCNFCVNACVVDVDPRNTVTYDACINCGACITACEQIRGNRNGGGSLLHFKFGARDEQRNNKLLNLNSLIGRTKWTIPLTMIGLGMFVWGLWSYQPYHMVGYQSDTVLHGDKIRDYRVSIAHKTYHPGTVHVRIEGLPADDFTLSDTILKFNGVARENIMVHVEDTLAAGIYPLKVHAWSEDGWQDVFQFNHVVTRGG